MDERERDRFYTTPDATSDGDEYEVEPPDPDVIGAEERHGRDVAESARMSIDIDEIYREADRNRGRKSSSNGFATFDFAIKRSIY